MSSLLIWGCSAGTQTAETALTESAKALPVAVNENGDIYVKANRLIDVKGIFLLRDTGAAFRPCGLAQGPDGSLYVSDSKKGRIWRIMHYGDVASN